MKKKILAIVTIFTLSVSFIAASNYYKAPKSDIEKAQYMNVLQSTNKNSKAIVQIGNEKITENDLKISKIFNNNLS